MIKPKYINHYRIFASIVLFFLFVIIFPLRLTAQNLLISPECVSYDAQNNRYLVSCFSPGKVVAIDSNGKQSNFRTGLGYCLSSTIYGNVLYLSTGKTIKGFNLSTAAEVMSVYISTSHQLDGMTADSAGNLYIADFHYQGSNDQIYKLNTVTHAFWVYVRPGIGLQECPQDIEYDKPNNRLIVVSCYDTPILAVNLADTSLSTVYSNSTVCNFDGIAKDNNGNFYATSWGTGMVYKFDNNFSLPAETIAGPFSGPANLGYNHEKNILGIPLYNSDTVIFYSLGPIGINNQNEVVKDFVLYQNYPNPFNPVTTLSFYTGKSAYVKISVFDIKGNCTDIIFEGKINIGRHSFTWDGTKFSSGVYFYKLETIDPSRGSMFSETKKMVLIK